MANRGRTMESYGRRRNLLHQNHLPEFLAYLERNGWRVSKGSGVWEEAIVHSPSVKTKRYVIHSSAHRDHLTVTAGLVPHVLNFIEWKKQV